MLALHFQNRISELFGVDIRRGVLICAGAKVLGNVRVGEGAKIGAGSVVLDDVPPHCPVCVSGTDRESGEWSETT